MTLRPCYRASCDAPGCTAAEMLPHDRTAAARDQLQALGWIVVKHHVRAEAPGAPRISYLCPSHRDERPPGWRSARAKEIRRQIQRRGAAREPRRVSLDGISPPTQHLERKRRAAMLWMLTEQFRSQAVVAIAAGVSRQRVCEIVASYDRRLERRRDQAASWQETWARRLRGVGAIP